MASSWPVGIIVKDNAGASSPLRLKDVGDQVTVPVNWLAANGAPSVTNYSFDLLLDGFPGIVVDAHSSGNGVIPRHDGSGIPKLTDNWMGISVSAANGTVGMNNSHFSGTPGVPFEGAEIATYYMDDSVGLVPEILDKAVLETSREHFGFSAASDDDITAMDYGIGLLSRHDASANMSFFSVEDTYYFSVSKDWADGYVDGNGVHYGFATPQGGGALVRAYGSDIYVVTYDGADWSDPEIYLTGADLSLNRATDDIDALSVDPNRGTVIFSATKGSTYKSGFDEFRSQLMIYQEADLTQNQAHPINQTQTSRPIKDKNGKRIARRLRLKDTGGDNADEIDGACAIDPEMGVFGKEVGTLTAYNASLGGATAAVPMGISATRVSAAGLPLTGDTLVQVTGWGDMTPIGCQLDLYMRNGTVPVGTTVPGTQWQRVGSAARTVNQGKVEFVLTDPASVFTTGNSYSFMALAFVNGRVKAGSMVAVMER